MDVPGDVPPFLTLVFDWFILDKWNNESTESKRQQHIRLGIEFAQLGHKGRRSYLFYALGQVHSTWREDFPLQKTFRPENEVPHDLLNDDERRLQKNKDVIWIRTDYSPGTDERHQELLNAVQDDGTVFHHPHNVMDNAERYAIEHFEDGTRPIYAFAPELVTAHGPGYVDCEYPYDSEEVQELVFPESDTEKQAQAFATADYFVADSEALRTGFLLWVHPDQFGNVLQWNRVQPWSLPFLIPRRGDFSRARYTEENGVLKSYGYDEDHVSVMPWEPQS